ncbi:hypothetical protein G2W53_026646 [Senna tora]|uniref:Uncharacterized protein n=1 Tax=Senna tora TaxID=362788 RepID=A0A834THD4_9FABA|nr:hypothetical protein G2W53_026646 [Senna tora]
MWQKLQIIHEANDDVKWNRMEMFINDLENFKTKPRESIEDMYSEFGKIINDLNALGLNMDKVARFGALEDVKTELEPNGSSSGLV